MHKQKSHTAPKQNLTQFTTCDNEGDHAICSMPSETQNINIDGVFYGGPLVPCTRVIFVYRDPDSQSRDPEIKK